MMRIWRSLVSGGAAVSLAGAIMLGTAPNALAAIPSCGQMERDYNDAVLEATSYYQLGSSYESTGDHHQAEYWFRQYRYQWLNISNMQLC